MFLQFLCNLHTYPTYLLADNSDVLDKDSYAVNVGQQYQEIHTQNTGFSTDNHFAVFFKINILCTDNTTAFHDVTGLMNGFKSAQWL